MTAKKIDIPEVVATGLLESAGKVRLQDDTDESKYVDLAVTSAENLLTHGDLTNSSFYHIVRGKTNSYTNYQTSSGGYSESTSGFVVGMTNKGAYIWNYASGGTLNIGAGGGADAITIDAANDVTAINNLAANGAVTLGDASNDAHTVNGTLALASEHATGPSAPAAGAGGILYVKTDGKLYFISDDVAETDLTSGGSADLTITTISAATYSATTYNTMYIIDSSSNAVEIDLPTASGQAGKTIDVLAKTGATNAVTIDPYLSETINGDSASLILSGSDFENVTLVSDGSNWVIR
jgi:hypothetical protein